MFEVDVYRAKLTGMPFGFAKNEFSLAEISAQAPGGRDSFKLATCQQPYRGVESGQAHRDPAEEH